MADRETVSVYNQQVERYATLTKQDKPDTALREFMTRIEPGGLVLDLGCGPGMASAHMRDRGLLVDPVDASSEMVRLANETHAIGARVAGFDDIDADQTYHGVWANFSLLHAEPDRFPVHLASLHRAIKAGGPFHIGMKLGSGAERDSLGRFYAYYSEAELDAHLSDAGFTPIARSFGEEMGLAGSVDPWITILSTA